MNVGDLVTLRLAREELECTILESSDSSIVLVKLTSGYNIGIPKDHIQGHVVLRKAGGTSERKTIKQAAGAPAIGLVLAGGTIASRVDPKTGAVNALTDVDSFLGLYPELMKTVRVKKIEVPFMKLSENMVPDDWIAIAECVHTLLVDPEIKGVVVAHGTDTLHYTAAALSFFLPNPSKPVVLTYSQRSSDRASSDARLNLICACRFALSDCAEVVLVGHGSTQDDLCVALRGSSVRKLHASRRDAFKSVNCEPIAKVWPDKVEFSDRFAARHGGESAIDAVFNDDVALVKFYPGAKPELLDSYAKYKGLVIEGFGLGNLPSAESKLSWIKGLKALIKGGTAVCIATQTVFGRVNLNVYSTGRELLDIGVIPVDSMTAETAFVKLGWILGHRNWRSLPKIKEKMLENVVGELNSLISE